jgi:hypothetical protein
VDRAVQVFRLHDFGEFMRREMTSAHSRETPEANLRLPSTKKPTVMRLLLAALAKGEQDRPLGITPTLPCPTCGHTVDDAHRFRVGAAEAEDIGYCRRCSRYVTRVQATGERGCLSWTPICHRCGQCLTLDFGQSTEEFHVYRCLDHTGERRGYHVTNDAWYRLDSI